jgi:hypothetical protein
LGAGSGSGRVKGFGGGARGTSPAPHPLVDEKSSTGKLWLISDVNFYGCHGQFVADGKPYGNMNICSVMDTFSYN